MSFKHYELQNKNKAELTMILKSITLKEVDETLTKAAIIQQILKAQEESGGAASDLIKEDGIDDLVAGENELLVERIHNGRVDRIVVSKDLWNNLPEGKQGYEIVIPTPKELEAPADPNGAGTGNGEGGNNGEGN